MAHDVNPLPKSRNRKAISAANAMWTSVVALAESLRHHLVHGHRLARQWSRSIPDSIPVRVSNDRASGTDFQPHL